MLTIYLCGIITSLYLCYEVFLKIIPQIIGFIAVATFLLSYQHKKRNNIILLNFISRCLYILQYLLLGAFTGAIFDILAAISSVFAGKKDIAFIKRYINFFCNNYELLYFHSRYNNCFFK